MGKLGDYITIKHGFAFKGNSISKEDNGVVLVTPGNFQIGGGFQEDKCKFFHGDYPEEYVLHENDLIVTMTDLSKDGDTLGYSAKVPFSSNRTYLHNQRIGLVCFKNEAVDKDFLYWYMRTAYYHKIVLTTSSGSTVKHTSPSRICEIDVDFPNLSVQRNISAILNAIEDKITLNTRINDNLQQQADAIFDENFPLQEPLPVGWRKSHLSSIAKYLNGLAMQKYRPAQGENGLPVLKIKELRQGMTDDNSEHCSSNIKPEYIVHDGDIIFSWSGSLLVDFWCGGDCGLNQHLFKVTSTQFDKWFVYAWTKHYLNHFIAVAADKATTMGHIKRDELDKAEVIIPSSGDYMEIGALMQPLYDEIISNRIESRKLSELRDALLPRMMSGELDVSGLDL